MSTTAPGRMMARQAATRWMMLNSSLAKVFGNLYNISRVEKERRAILSKIQMMNTIEYRVDC
jgi:hypothetical protein